MKTVLILSGGMDSTTLLYHMLADKHEVACLGVNYGQRHAKELTFAERLCRDLEVPWEVADLSKIKPLLAGSSQTSDDLAVPEGHYAEESMKLTVVPNRNMLMLSLAGAWAISRKADVIAYAAHAGDHAIYPDCRPEFVDALDKTFALADWHQVKILRPFINMTKADIVLRGSHLGVPFEKTWSCYKGLDRHCGLCGTCRERREAFQLAGVADPTGYSL